MSLSRPNPIASKFGHRLTALAKRWNLRPAEIVEGAILWTAWTGLTWLAFGLSLLFIEVGETGEVGGRAAWLGGCLVGVGQWLALRPYLRKSYRWAIATGLSWGLLCLIHLGAIGWTVPQTPNLLLRGIFGILYGSYVGLGLGMGQWWALRPKVIQAWRWIPLNVGIWAVGIAFAWMIGGGLRAASGLFLGEVVGLVFGWGAIAALSGIGIVGLLYSTSPTQPDEH